MRRILDTAALLVSIALLTGVLLARDDREEGAPASPPSPAEVEGAIARGVEFLRRAERPDGSFDRDAGLTGLALYALAHCRVAADDPAVRRALRALRARLDRPDTYGSSLAIMALATLDRGKHAKLIRRLADLLARGQCRNGQWSYQLRPGRSTGDNSNTQFAVLALWYARRAGAKIDPKVFARCLKYLVESQNEDGGWGYSARERKKSYGSMVATGLAGLVVCRSGARGLPLSDERARGGPEVARAVAWIGKRFSVVRNPGASFKLGRRMRGVRKEVRDSFWRFYWLWSLERAATLAGIEEIGGHAWYAAGARELIRTQRKDGSWVGSEAPVPATSFALLFLSRSTRRAVETERKEWAGTRTPTPR